MKPDGGSPAGSDQNGRAPVAPSGTPRLARAREILGHPDVLAVTAAVLLPNALFIAGLVADLGMPPRSIAIALYLLPVFLLNLFGRAASLVLFVVVLGFDVVWTLASFFGFSLQGMLEAFRFATEVRLLASPLYVALILTVVATSATAMASIAIALPRVRPPRLLPTVLAAAMLTLVDGQILRVLADGGPASEANVAPVVSATAASGFAEAVLSPERPTGLLVIVEALGQFADPVLHDLVFSPLDREDLRASYDISSGAVPFHGSTTAAEVRELCASRLPYDALSAANTADCLPRRLAEQGRESVAIHGFSRVMFERPRWYPFLGFTRQMFGEDLATLSARRCGSVFVGLCDVDIAQALPAITGRAPQGGLIYWLTLNTHVPFRPTDARPRFNCTMEGGRFGHSDVCRMAELWAELVDRIADLAAGSQLGRTEILFVGDHAPPLWSRRGRSMFTPGMVPWLRLRPRS